MLIVMGAVRTSRTGKLMCEEIEVEIMKVSLNNSMVSVNVRLALDFMINAPLEGNIIQLPGKLN